MKTIAFIKSTKENEKRRAVVPDDLNNIVHTDYLFFEDGYGDVIGASNDEYIKKGCKIVSREEALKKDIICDPKVGDAEYLDELEGQTVFGWVHAVQNKDVTDKLVNHHLTAICWEDMFESGRHVFWRNNELAGEAAIMHAFQCFGIMPYNAKVALLGRGNVANGALKILTLLGADVTIYSRKMEQLFREEFYMYDVIVNAILWDTNRTDHILYAEDLDEWKRYKKDAMIVDVSCDRSGGIETSVPTTIEQPVYVSHGVLHYVVDHTPSLIYKTTTNAISREVTKYLDALIEDGKQNVLVQATSIKNGIILDERIKSFQNRIM